MSTGNRAATAILVTADAAIGTSGASILVYAVTLLNGTADASINLRNGTSATATSLWKLGIVLNATAEVTSISQTFPKPIAFPSGCFADITGTAAVAYVAYAPA